MQKKISYLLVGVHLAVAATCPVYSQERVAGGSMALEASWSALKNLADKAVGDARTAQILANAIRICGLKGMVYGPGSPGADGEGCREGTNSTVGSLQNQINNLTHQLNAVQNRPVAAPACSVSTDFGQCVLSQGANYQVQGNYRQCPSGYAFTSGDNYSTGAGGQWRGFTCCRMVVSCH